MRRRLPSDAGQRRLADALNDPDLRQILTDRTHVPQVMSGPNTHWFSARLRLVRVIEAVGVHEYENSVVIFHAADGATAFGRALELGRARERAFRTKNARVSCGSSWRS